MGFEHAMAIRAHGLVIAYSSAKKVGPAHNAAESQLPEAAMAIRAHGLRTYQST